jgi:UDP-2,3-diacylglucosamine hydrolase
MSQTYLEITGDDVRFVADAHFRSAHDPTEAARRRRFIAFVGSLTAGTTLFLLGDIFDFYFEYRHVVSNRYLDVFAALINATARGVDLHFLGGNHDFWVGRSAEREFGMTLHRDRILLSAQGRRIVCAHGDLVQPGDYGYKMLKTVIRNPVVIGASRWIHPDLLDAVASKVSHGSRAIQRENHERQAIALVDYAHRHYFGAGNDAFIMGHIHHPLHEVRNGRDFMILGDWIKDFTYGRLAGGKLSLERFTEPSTD